MCGAAYGHLLEPYYDRLYAFGDGRVPWERATADLPEHVVDLFALQVVSNEIANGELWQLFFNHSGTIAPEAVRAFRRIGLPEAAEPLSRAMRKLADPYPLEVAERRAILPNEDHLLDMPEYPFHEETERFFDLALAVRGDGPEQCYAFEQYAAAYAARHA